MAEMVPKYLLLGPAPDFTNFRDRRLRRTLEMIPGALTWATLVGMGAAAFIAPTFAGLFIIAFATYWILNALYFSVFIVRSWLKMRKNIRTNWLALLRALPPPNYSVRTLRAWEELVHLVIFPMYREPEEVVGESLEAVARSEYPQDRLWVVLAVEARGGEQTLHTARALESRFRQRFGRFLVVVHPESLPGEIPGKGSNQSYAAREVVRAWIDDTHIPYEHVVVSSFDSDTRVLPQYFARLTYAYLTTAQPTRASFQPIPLFNNNIWEAPTFSRIVAMGSTAWQLFMQSQPDLQETFSSHSMSLSALVDVGYWNTRLVNEDSIIFWQCYLAFDGNYRVVPLYHPVSMDANVGRTHFSTAKSVYKQHRRWAYGIEKFVYAVFGFIKNPRISARKKVSWTVRLSLGFWMWACASPLLLTLGWLPVVTGGEAFRQTVLAFNLPLWTRNLMLGASVGLLINGALAFLLLPPRPKNVSRVRALLMFLQWPLMPFSMLLFGSLPAIDAQTRMMLGKYLGFWVTEKVRKKR